jgi:hypothetical protein
MISDKRMEDYARDCVRLAHRISDPVLRERLLQMAREWMAAAMHEEMVPEAVADEPLHVRGALD